MSKLGRVIRNVAHYGGGSLGNILYHAGLRGKKIKKAIGLRKPSISSAGSYAYQRGEYYGRTGSITGRY